MLAGPPDAPVVIADAVRSLIGDEAYEVVWVNELGGVTYRLAGPSHGVHVKWTPASSGIDLGVERVKLEWARAFTPVPEVIDAGADSVGSWLVTRSINADNAVSSRWKRDPQKATTALGLGLRALHDSMAREVCPFSWSAAQRIGEVDRRVAQGLLDQLVWGEGFDGPDLSIALGELRDVPDDDLVVCHGDACAPNTLLDDGAKWVAHVDLGSLGVADRWADLAVMSWSTVWNYGPGWEANVYDSYGIEPDVGKIRYYRLLWGME
jgi:kanamycin kinase